MENKWFTNGIKNYRENMIKYRRKSACEEMLSTWFDYIQVMKYEHFQYLITFLYDFLSL